jgi:tRNA 2-thiocytidine biosynthesis protein TtcA
MPPKLVSDDGQNVVIRPLAYCAEKDIERFARGMEYPIIPCNLCGSQENAQRKQIKAMLRDWDERFPGRIVSISTAMKNIVPSHMADAELFDFRNVSRDTQVEQGDIVFDSPELPSHPEQETAIPIGFWKN